MRLGFLVLAVPLKQLAARAYVELMQAGQGIAHAVYQLIFDMCFAG